MEGTDAVFSACSIDLHMEDDTLSFCSAGEVAEQGAWSPSQWLGSCEVTAEPMAPSPLDSRDMCHSVSMDTCTSGGEPEAPTTSGGEPDAPTTPGGEPEAPTTSGGEPEAPSDVDQGPLPVEREPEALPTMQKPSSLGEPEASYWTEE